MRISLLSDVANISHDYDRAASGIANVGLLLADIPDIKLGYDRAASGITSVELLLVDVSEHDYDRAASGSSSVELLAMLGTRRPGTSSWVWRRTSTVMFARDEGCTRRYL